VCRDSTQLPITETADDDLALVHASKSGDVAAFEELVKRYDRKLLRIAKNLMHNREDAEEAVQETFLKAFQHLGQFRGDAKFSTWLIRIAMNQSLMMLRKLRSAREVSIDKDFQSEERNLPIDVADWAPNPEQLYGAAELREILRDTLKQLHPRLRAVFVLRDIEGLSVQQTADALNLTLVAVKARSWRARSQLRERLSKHFRSNDGQESAACSPTRACQKRQKIRQQAEYTVSSNQILHQLQTSFDEQVTRRSHRFDGRLIKPNKRTEDSLHEHLAVLAVKQGTQHILEPAEFRISGFERLVPGKR
jgi:RNA polymerase sigma-70 factor (ECF subfamily)